jgi:hypothetical protein
VEPEGILELPLHGLDVWVLHQECGAQLPVKKAHTSSTGQVFIKQGEYLMCCLEDSHFFKVLCSTLLHLTPLRYLCVGKFWE